ncbi:protein kinase domain-containing protein [Haliangium sp.]|uniref:serine/threonine-protein kinase n=1 Tax=Haliangium sp. TaxID=2663208 RepID=UPI003D0FE96B
MSGVRSGRSLRVQELFHAALGVETSKRGALLDRLCGGNAELRREVEGLLDASVPSFLDRPARPARPVDTLMPEAHAPDDAIDPERVIGPGTEIGQYELIRRLGHGGMSVVYLARDTKLGRRVAIKFMKTRSQRFLFEARATARCDHDNIVVIYDVDEYRGVPFIVLEYLKGHPLAQLMARGPQPPQRAIQLVAPVVRALMCAHANGIVHRDLKPENIFLTNTGAIRVLDFGIAKPILPAELDALGPHATGEVLTPLAAIEATGTDVAVGTPLYMAPEQWRADDVDHRADLWATGILLYQMITGHHPLQIRPGRDRQVPLTWHELAVIGDLDVPMPSARDADMDLPAPLAAVIDRCLEKHPHRRVASASALLEALATLLPGRAEHEFADAGSPYTGLAPFEEADADRFFGRDRDIRAVLTQLYDAPLMGVIGPSGAGKSSFVRAGIVPALKRSGEQWETYVLRPGRYPMANLATILAPAVDDEFPTSTHDGDPQPLVLRRLRKEPGYLGAALRQRARFLERRILVFVDQFEELYTLTTDPDERRAFTRCLLGMADDATSPLRLILAVRSDFLDRAAEDRAFMRELSQGAYFLTAPSRDGLREALTRPAEMRGCRFESSSMVEAMLDTLETTPNALPLLQFTATKLWEARDREQKLLTQSAYTELGGVDGALASHADAVLKALAPQDQTLARALFMHLVTPERTRALALVAELCQVAKDAAAARRVLDHLVQARLLVVQRGDVGVGEDAGDGADPGDDSTGESASVEIVHESLIHGWPTLAHWLDEGQEDIAFLEQLRTAAKLWDRRGRPHGLLWRGEAMEEAQRWRRRYRGELPALQRAYLNAVFALARRTERRRVCLVVATMGVLVLLVLAAGIALIKISNAELEAREAERQVRAQLAVIQAKERDRQEALRDAEVAENEAAHASARVAQSEEELAMTNTELRVALVKSRAAERQALAAFQQAERESERARAESARAQHAADEARAAKERANQAIADLEAALDRERQRQREQERRLEELEERVGTVGAGLK